MYAASLQWHERECQEPPRLKGRGLAEMGWHLPVFSVSLPDQTQPGCSSEHYRATISARLKNVPRDALPVSCSITLRLIRCTRVKPVLERCADRYHRQGKLYLGNQRGFERSDTKRSPERGDLGRSERSRACAHFSSPCL
jgi:hypothetical protein